MFKHFFMLEWKAFFRSSAFGANLVMKIFMGLFAAYFAFMFVIAGIFMYPGLEKAGLKPLEVINQYIIFYLVGDLIIRYFMQKMPVMNIKPLLITPIKRSTIVHFAMGKSVISFFNFAHAFVLIPFTISLLIYEPDKLHMILWHFSIVALILANNFINLMVNNKNSVFYPVLIVVLAFVFATYYGWFDVTVYTKSIFQLLSSTYYGFLIPMLFLGGLYWGAFRYFDKRLSLDTGLAKKTDIAKSEDFNWLNQFGSMGVFLKNDIRLLKRNKRSRTTVIMSFLFIFYGLIFMTGAIETYRGPFWQVFAGIFVSGGFMFTFGQFVPSWDSAYYQLMMSQNIKYKEYLASKWWLISIATVISTIIASFYLMFGWKVYLLICVGAIYNIGVNSYLVLFAGAYVKTPIDLSSSKQAFGDKQAFNVKTLLITLPKMLLPIAIYGIGYYTVNEMFGCALLAIFGIAGLAFRNKMFSVIERIYKREKYKTIQAYKQKS
ncbi:MAG: hypothetical protein EOO50_03440 [Flavobacterium sp.]|uniref:DUF5687 family protein n=1 Tax=Flavobacterium sp. TaxID=239 RepID=UPI001218BB66|nr:DUF5687 family protein [Flavobacterium sp.]RZJ67888.1 MAG: hypothetical protein EOO50_03440 [Flavobacterium sp.]